MSWLCRVFGHRVSTVLSPWHAGYLGDGHWMLPADISFCPRCGMVYQPAGVGCPDPEKTWVGGGDSPQPISDARQAPSQGDSSTEDVGPGPT